MIIEQIEFKNYRQYRGKFAIEFGYSRQKNVNIIVGSNGSGKTNISNALQWCLYGKEPSLKPGIDFGILNMEIFKKMVEKEINDVSVKVTFQIDEGETYCVERCMTISKINNKQVVVPYSGSNEEPDGSMLKAYFFPSNKVKHPSYDVNFPSTLINTLAPEKISEYFFFDGEKLENYFEASSNEKIKESIFKISQLDLLDKIENRLEKMINDYRNESRRNSPDLERINQEIEKIQDELNNNNNEIRKNNKEISSLKDQRKDLFEKYQRLGGENVKKLLEENKEIEIELEKLRKELQEKEDEKSNFLLSNSYLFLVKDSFDESILLFKDARKKGIIPPDINPDFIKQLLKIGECICGTDIKNNKGNCYRTKVEKLLNKVSSLGSKAGEMVEIERDIYNILDNKYKSFFSIINLHNEAIKKIDSRVEALDKKYNENNTKVGEAKLDKMENFRMMIDDLNSEIEKSSGRGAVLLEKNKDLEERLSYSKKEFIELNKKWEKGKYINQCILFCERAQECAKKIKTKIMNEIREEISKVTEQHYRELHWKKEENIVINIDEDYKISAKQEGYNKFGAFSAGEDALLALSFIFALNRVSGFNVPIILDTALGRIDPKPRANFAKNISDYLEMNQIVLLFTQAEYTPEVKSNLSPSINKEYNIKLNSPWSAEINIIK